MRCVVALITKTIDTPPNDLTDDFNLINLWVYCQATALQMELTDAVNMLNDTDLAVVIVCLDVLAVVVVHADYTNLLTYVVMCHNCNLFKGFVLLLFDDTKIQRIFDIHKEKLNYSLSLTFDRK